ncbi:hypothetical protein [Streptomyces sp. NBC_00287]|uniref:hypothetical protein n=1 Tax=Streptomyces sp. NBC_00287 TaxID=2975702 RepID=UPI002E2DBEC4|nr:hypothetical protein [Streptomyces sp. NBC_00287]
MSHQLNDTHPPAHTPLPNEADQALLEQSEQTVSLPFYGAWRISRVLLILVENQKEEPHEGEEPSTLSQSHGFGRGEVELVREGCNVERLVHPASHVFSDLCQLKGAIAESRVLKVDDLHARAVPQIVRKVAVSSAENGWNVQSALILQTRLRQPLQPGRVRRSVEQQVVTLRQASVGIRCLQLCPVTVLVMQADAPFWNSLVFDRYCC